MHSYIIRYLCTLYIILYWNSFKIINCVQKISVNLLSSKGSTMQAILQYGTATYPAERSRSFVSVFLQHI